jgi:hypothetical protein
MRGSCRTARDCMESLWILYDFIMKRPWDPPGGRGPRLGRRGVWAFLGFDAVENRQQSVHPGELEQNHDARRYIGEGELSVVALAGSISGQNCAEAGRIHVGHFGEVYDQIGVFLAERVLEIEQGFERHGSAQSDDAPAARPDGDLDFEVRNSVEATTEQAAPGALYVSSRNRVSPRR